MLTHVVKRNGQIEPFMPNKLNFWGQWASQTLNGRVDWSSTVLDSVKGLSGTIDSQVLQDHLIQACLRRQSWSYQIMAGRLYAARLRKQLYPDGIPSVEQLHRRLLDLGLMRSLNYASKDYQLIEQMIDHTRDFEYAHYQIQHLHSKYSVQNRTDQTRYEIPQFVFMRMAMALAEDEPKESRLLHVRQWYDHFSKNRLSAPTPNYVNLGTPHNSYASCCLYTVEDSAASLAIGDHIAYTMTYMSAGIGANLNTRSLGDPVRSGLLQHQGKLPYYKSLASAVKANMQSGRGGACTAYFSCYDPEAITIAMLQNPLTPKDKQNRDIHFAVLMTKHFAKKVASDEQIFTFNTYTAPDLTQALYSGDESVFETLYARYESDDSFVKEYVSARQRFLAFARQSYDVGTFYYAFIDEINRHTPFKDPIYSSNLCLEIMEPTQPYRSMIDLYSETDHQQGEIALCNLAAINVGVIETDEDYASAMYYALKMIDKTVLQANYTLPHLGYTARQRLNAGVGIIGLAYAMAKQRVSYTSQEGRDFVHRVAERHAYMAISQSLALSKEYGCAPWIHKTKWPEGWLPIDTYKRSVDQLTPPVYQYDWESLRTEIIKNGGIRHSTLIAHMPTESSSKASSVPNSLYPIRDYTIKKTDLKNTLTWTAPEDDVLRDHYQIAWTIPAKDLIAIYAIVQKFTDQGISADLYRDRSETLEIQSSELIEEFLWMVKYGLKTRYYQNSYIVSACHDRNQKAREARQAEPVCVDGACSL